MAKSLNWWTRKLHRWGAVLMALPLLVVIVSGLLLQVKKQVTWVQPETMSGSGSELEVEWDQILQSARSDANAAVAEWSDIRRLDVRPGKGLIKVQCKNGWELQLDSGNAKILASNYRRSDLIESIHDGSFFSDAAKLWLFLPNGIVLFLLWISGAYLWYLPFASKAAKRKRKQANKNNEAANENSV